MALSPLSTGLFSWSGVTYTIRELTGHRWRRGAERRKRGDDCSD